MVAVSGAVEGLVDRAVWSRLVEYVGAAVGPVHGLNGKSSLRRSLSGYNAAAQHSLWLVLVDLDQDAECVPPFRATWLSSPSLGMCFRVVVRAIEAWLLADTERLAKFLAVPVARVPGRPESVSNPKRAMVELARRSRRQAIREDMVPRPGSGRPVGPAYTSRLIEFAVDHWRPEVAASRADSLGRCLKRLRERA